MGGTISDIVKVVDEAVKQIILQIDPSIVKMKNTTIVLLDHIESKVHSNGSQALDVLKRNLLIWLFLSIVFGILLLILIRFYLDVLQKLHVGLLVRQYSTLFLLTIIVFWLFVATIFGLFISEDIRWSTLKLIVFVLLCLIISLLSIIWFRFAKIYKKRLGRTLLLFFCHWSSLKEKQTRLEQSTMTLHMLALQKKALTDNLNHI